MSFPYHKVLVLGATSGIGRALAERFIANGSHVVAVGRRQNLLDDFVAQQAEGEAKAFAHSFDVSRVADIPSFAKSITTVHPDIDCVLLNAGIQRVLDFSKPDTVDMDLVQEEMLVNYVSVVALTKAFLPFFLAKDGPSTLMYTSSGLALVPIAQIPNYCASKAAMHQFIIALREQLSQSKIKIVELFPPLVQSELHDSHPGAKNPRSWGMPVDVFADKTIEGLAEGKEDVPVGSSVRSYDAIEGARSAAQKALLDAVKAEAAIQAELAKAQE